MVRPGGICTCTGTGRIRVVLFPNCPKKLFPRPRRCHPTQAPESARRPGDLGNWCARSGSCTCTGTDELVVVLFPNCRRGHIPRPRRCHPMRAPESGGAGVELGDGATGGDLHLHRYRRFVVLFPNWPKKLFPQAQTVPSDASAPNGRRPASSWVMVRPAGPAPAPAPTNPLWCCFPNCPELLYPQAQTVPSDASATECTVPAASWVMVRPPGSAPAPARTSSLWCCSPTCPELLSPRPHTGAIRRERQRMGIAGVELGDGASGGDCTCTGTDEFVLVLFPNWPEVLLPQAQTVPSTRVPRSGSRRLLSGL